MFKKSFVPGLYLLSGLEVEQSHWLSCPAEVILCSPAEEFQTVTGAADPVLHSCHRVRLIRFYKSLDSLSCQIRHQKATLGYWEKYCCCPTHPSRTIYIQTEKELRKLLRIPHIVLELLLSVWRYRALNTITARHKITYLLQAMDSSYGLLSPLCNKNYVQYFLCLTIPFLFLFFSLYNIICI